MVAERSAVVGALVAAVVGGVIGWATAFSGLGVSGLIIGLVATVIVILTVRSPGDR